MRKYLYLLAFLLTLQMCGFSQNIDSIKVDSLKKNLPALRDNKRVDCLNSIVKLSLGYGKLQARVDSSSTYAIMANNEATRLAYKAGISKSLLNLGEIQNIKVNINRNAGKYDNDGLIKTWAGYVHKAILEAAEIQHSDLLGDCYYMLSEIQGRNKEFGSQNDSYKKAIYYFQKAHNSAKEFEVTVWLCQNYSYSGDYEEGLKYAQRCEQLMKERPAATDWEHELVNWSFSNIAMLYKAAGEYTTALGYLLKSNQYAKEHNAGVTWDVDISELYCLKNQFDSAFYYWQTWKRNWNSYAASHQGYGNSILGLIYLKTGQPDKALTILNESIVLFRKGKKETPMIRALIFSGQAYVEKKNYSTALNYARNALSISSKNNTRPSIVDSYELLSVIFHNLGRNDSAYYYLKKYMTIKDSLINRQFLWRIKNYKNEAEEAKKEARIGFLDRDNKIKQEQLKQEASLKKFLIAGLILLLITGIFIFQYVASKRKNEKLESEKKQAELQQRATELEMQALRAQMNPHFIFNCLSSINKFILKNDGDAASDYLTRFSRLIRQSLTNSQLSLIPLSDEIEMLRLYLDMERLRFSESFNYNIIYENTIEPETIYIPPMLLQPFCENAIWHGLMHKEGQGKLEIMMRMQDDQLQCVITDNGIGREKAAELKSKTGAKQKSFGLKITTERLALFNNEKAVHSFYKTEDVLDSNGNSGGTKVILNIKFKNNVQQPLKELI